MNVIFLLQGDEKALRPLTANRPISLLSVAGNTVLGHMLLQISESPAEQTRLIFMAHDRPAQLEAWLQATYPSLDGRVIACDGRSVAGALQRGRDYLTGELLLIAGEMVTLADFEALRAGDADSVQLMGVRSALADEVPTPTGVYWFRAGAQVRAAVEALAPAETLSLDAVVDHLRQQGVTMATQAADQWLPIQTPADLLSANQRLLALGYGSEEAIERSYLEDFAVKAPVFLHSEAVVDTAVLGPYVSIDAGAVVKNSVIANSIIAAGAHVENCILDGSIVGRDARVTGSTRELLVGDQAHLSDRLEITSRFSDGQVT